MEKKRIYKKIIFEFWNFVMSFAASIWLRRCEEEVKVLKIANFCLSTS